MAQLLPDPVRHVRRLVVDLEDFTPDLDNLVRLIVRIEMGDGHSFVLNCEDMGDGDLGDLPSDLRDLLDAWLWGPGLTAVLNQADRLSRGEKQKRVRRALRSFN